ncbi:MAG TPA: aromatic amino acid transport family protein [Candidatus Paceibacterota bacterium]|nr:aromatic amino acid transport family protein [Candidatus Paceibacterota bacterium]
MRRFWKVAAIVAAATVGDGVFALPFVFYQAGWLLCLLYLAVLGAMVAVAHVVYFRTLEASGEKERLLGLARQYFGPGGFWVGFTAIVLGLLLALVAYLILGSQFIQLGFPGIPPGIAVAAFWAFIAGIVLLGDARVVELEMVGILFTALVIVLIFVTTLPHLGFGGAPAVNMASAFLPFGAVLFSVAGWTSVEPAYESSRGKRWKFASWLPLVAGTLLAVLLYLLFVSGILGSGAQITPDTISGLGGWEPWKRGVIAALGLFAVATSSMPISREIRNALEKDLRWNRVGSRALIIFFPLACVMAGLNDFLVVVTLVGGVFLSVQYLLIVAIGRRALAPPPAQKFLLDAIALVFIAAAAYQIIGFIVK